MWLGAWTGRREQEAGPGTRAAGEGGVLGGGRRQEPGTLGWRQETVSRRRLCQGDQEADWTLGREGTHTGSVLRENLREPAACVEARAGDRSFHPSPQEGMEA